LRELSFCFTQSSQSRAKLANVVRDPLIMKARIYVTLKPSVLDPQGKAIHHAVETIGYRGISDVRQGKYFEVTLDAGLSDEEARATIERMARDVLANPVIEDFRVELDSDTES
jgi:phosphoribosylformylglycinamidine synthase PurS subunit